jgi:Leucine-rich repeat (LRR) protein
LNGENLLTCDIFTQTIDSQGFKINLGANADDFDKVEGLRFNENENMKFLPEGIGDTFPNLQGLIGVQTYLTVINANDLKGLKKLKYLSLAKSDLKVIEKDVFSDLISLTELDLSDAGIRSIDEHAFQGLSALKTLYLGANKLTQLEPNTFSALTSLESISLEFNHLEAIDDNLFASNTLLADIWLNSNKITIMDWKVFENLKSLSYVDVQENPCIDGVYDSSIFNELKDGLKDCVVTEAPVVNNEKNAVTTTKKLEIRNELSVNGKIFERRMKLKSPMVLLTMIR